MIHSSERIGIGGRNMDLEPTRSFVDDQDDNIAIGTAVTDKNGTWMHIVSIERDIANCQYSDGHGMLTVSRKLSELKEVKE
jgi:polygalacturonase